MFERWLVLLASCLLVLTLLSVGGLIECLGQLVSIIGHVISNLTFMGLCYKCMIIK